MSIKMVSLTLALLTALAGCSAADQTYAKLTDDDQYYLVKKQMTGQHMHAKLDYVIDPFAGEIKTNATAKLLFKKIEDNRTFHVSKEMTTTAFIKTIPIDQVVSLGSDGFTAKVTSRDEEKIQLFISDGRVKLDMAVNPNKPMIEFMYGSFDLESPIKVSLSLSAVD